MLRALSAELANNDADEDDAAVTGGADGVTEGVGTDGRALRVVSDGRGAVEAGAEAGREGVVVVNCRLGRWLFVPLAALVPNCGL